MSDLTPARMAAPGFEQLLCSSKMDLGVNLKARSSSSALAPSTVFAE